MSEKIEIEDAPELKAGGKNSEDPDFPYISINIRLLMWGNKKINCDIFIRLTQSKLTRVFSVESGLDFIRLKQYIEKGVHEVYVRKEDWVKFNQYLQTAPELVLGDQNASRQDQVDALLSISEQNVADFFTKVPLSEVSVEKTKVIVKRMVSSLSRDPNLLSALMRMAKHHDFMLSHSIWVSIISMLIARGAQNANERMLEICGAGGFLHDIGKTQIAQEIVMKYGELTPEQWKEMRHHPLLGLKMLERCQNISEEIKLIIMQHHEQPGGAGYPTGMRGPKIFYPAKIVAIADAFAAMISNQSYQKTFTPEQAIAEMQSDPGKFDRDLIYVVGQLFKLKI